MWEEVWSWGALDCSEKNLFIPLGNRPTLWDSMRRTFLDLARRPMSQSQRVKANEFLRHVCPHICWSEQPETCKILAAPSPGFSFRFFTTDQSTEQQLSAMQQQQQQQQQQQFIRHFSIAIVSQEAEGITQVGLVSSFDSMDTDFWPASQSIGDALPYQDASEYLERQRGRAQFTLFRPVKENRCSSLPSTVRLSSPLPNSPPSPLTVLSPSHPLTYSPSFSLMVQVAKESPSMSVAEATPLDLLQVESAEEDDSSPEKRFKVPQ